MYYIIQSRSGFIAVRTSTLIIFGSYSSSMYPAVCVEAVEKLGKGNLMGEWNNCMQGELLCYYKPIK